VSEARERRVSNIRRLLAAAERVYESRHLLSTAIAQSTGLSSEGVELGFGYLERSASDAELAALVDGVSEAAHVHVILSANVFVAPLRALALAIATAPKVTVRPSRRDPWLTRALVTELGERSVEIVEERSVASLDADAFHVYGRDSTIAAVRTEARLGTKIRGHGAGFGIVLLSRSAEPDAAAASIAIDVAAFDQRGCLSPRLVLVDGTFAQTTRVAESIHRELGAVARRVPRGHLDAEERAEARRWADTISFAGRTWTGPEHVVGLGPEGQLPALPPAGRHVQIARVSSLEHARMVLEPTARFIVAIASDDLGRARSVVPAHARLSPLGSMQRPPLDGPVDRRPAD
jgi:hypothetical protein